MTKLIKATVIVAAVLASTTTAAQERHYINNSGRLTTVYRCLHLATAAGNPSDAGKLLLIGDYEGLRRGLSAAHLGEVKGYSRRWSEEDVRTHGSPTAAFNALDCKAIAQSPIVGENPNQRVPPPELERGQ